MSSTNRSVASRKYARLVIPLVVVALLVVAIFGTIELNDRHSSTASTSQASGAVVATSSFGLNSTANSTAKTPLWTYSLNGTINSIAISEDGEHIAAGVGYGSNGGAVLFFDRGGDLLWQYKTDRVIAYVAISEDGTHILANGLYSATSPEVYGFDSNGSLVWSRPSTGAMSPDGTRVAIIGPNSSLAMLTWQGQVIWNYSSPVAGCAPAWGICPIAFQNGSLVVAGPHGITMLGPTGNLLWTSEEANNIWTDSAALTPDGEMVAASLDAADDTNGTVMLLSAQGEVLWEHGSEGGAVSGAVLPDGSSVAYTAAAENRVLFYSQNGTLLDNFTTSSGFPSVYPTLNDTFLLGGEGSDGLVLFNSRGGAVWNYPINDTLTAAVSSDGNFAAASAGLGSTFAGEQAPNLRFVPSTLYFFDITGKAAGG
jgi:PQQ-like domain